MGRYYRDYADFLADRFPGRKMQKLTVDAGFSCPNRDGSLSRGGCSYCNNSSFSPMTDGSGRKHLSVTEQIAHGRDFFGRKYPDMGYLAYFQSYTNTHGELDRLLALYDEALAAPGVEGLVIGTRPDCLPEPLLDALGDRSGLGARIMIELGAESSHDATLSRVNRCHTWGCVVDAVMRLKSRAIPVGLHLIMGLPGESRPMMLETVRRAAALKPETLKFHQLQIIEGSALARQYAADSSCVSLFTPEEYLDLCVEIVGVMNTLAPETAIDRFTSSAPADLLVAPKWGLKNYQFVNLLHRRLAGM